MDAYKSYKVRWEQAKTDGSLMSFSFATAKRRDADAVLPVGKKNHRLIGSAAAAKKRRQLAESFAPILGFSGEFAEAVVGEGGGRGRGETARGARGD